MPKPDELPAWHEGEPDEALEAAMRQDESLRDEVLKHRRLERGLQVLLAPEDRTRRLKSSIHAAVNGASFETLRAQVLAQTSRPRRVWRSTHIGWAAGIAAVLAVAAVLMLRPVTHPNAMHLAGAAEGAEVRREGRTDAAVPDMELRPGDEIHAGSQAVKLRFAQESTVITLEPQTVIRVRSLAPRKQFELLQGGLEADVARQTAGAMLWTTDNAEARVLGTRFGLTADGVFTRLDVSKGAVELQRLGTVEQTVVHAGEFAAADAHQLLEAQPLTTKPVWNVPEHVTPGFDHVSFVSATAGMEMGVNVLLPPQYADLPERRYPVLYFLHDTGGDEHSEAARFGPAMRLSMVRREVPPFIAVFPNVGPGHTPQPWLMGEVLARDLTRFIDERYRTAKFRGLRVVAGIGQGGHRALMLTAMQGMLFSSCIVMDDPLHGGPPGFRLLLERIQGRMSRFDLQALLLHSRAEPVLEVERLARFLNEVDIDAKLASLDAGSPADPSYTAEAWRLLVPELVRQWQPPPGR